ncbi:hypothetical protein LCGC14_2765330, partial [marine sediment metagenome]
AFLYKHGFARLIHYTSDDPPGAGEPDLPDQEEEEEVIGELLEARHGKEDWKYLVPANVSELFAHAIADTDKEIEATAMADVLTGRMPPAGTTGYLMSQVNIAAVSKYVPILQQAARAIRGASLYMTRRIDEELESEVVVHAQLDESTDSPYFFYKPGFSRGNENLEVYIEAPLPSDQIARTQWLVALNKQGYISKERVQREGPRVQQPEMENEKMRLEKFQEFYEPIAMMRAIPGMVLMAPADAHELRAAVAFAMTLDRPCAIRYPRDEVPQALPGPCPPFELGRSRTVREGTDAAILAYGAMVEPALAAADKLKQAGAEITRLVFALDRMEGARENVQAAGLEFNAILTTEDLGVK